MSENEQAEVVTAVAFCIAFLESELPEQRRNLSPWEREVQRSVEALRALHRRLSPLDNRLAGLGTPFHVGNRRETYQAAVGEPGPEDPREALASNFNVGPGW